VAVRYKERIEVSPFISSAAEGRLKVRGVLGNKCAGQHNLKTLHFKDPIVLGTVKSPNSVTAHYFVTTSKTF
jgi:hypothetical protein